MTEDFVQVLWDECYGSNGFRIKLHAELTWDKVAFDRLTEAMRACCKHYALSDRIASKFFCSESSQKKEKT